MHVLRRSVEIAAQGGRSTPNLLTTVSDCRMSKTSVQPVEIKEAFASWERPLQELRMWKMMLRRKSPHRAQSRHPSCWVFPSLLFHYFVCAGLPVIPNRREFVVKI